MLAQRVERGRRDADARAARRRRAPAAGSRGSSAAPPAAAAPSTSVDRRALPGRGTPRPRCGPSRWRAPADRPPRPSSPRGTRRTGRRSSAAASCAARTARPAGATAGTARRRRVGAGSIGSAVEVQVGRRAGEPFELRVGDAEAGEDERRLVQPPVALVRPARTTRARRRDTGWSSASACLAPGPVPNCSDSVAGPPWLRYSSADLVELLRIQRDRLRRVLDGLAGRRAGRSARARRRRSSASAGRRRRSGRRTCAAPCCSRSSRPVHRTLNSRPGTPSAGGAPAHANVELGIGARHGRLAAQVGVREVRAGQARAQQRQEVAQQRLAGVAARERSTPSSSRAVRGTLSPSVSLSVCTTAPRSCRVRSCGSRCSSTR